MSNPIKGHYKIILFVNQQKCIELGITSINQAHVFDMVANGNKWAAEVLHNEMVYYWMARQAISEQLPLLNLKPDTIYRHLKSLSELGLIEHIKIGKKDCVRLTEKGKSYYVGNKSEFTMSEINPNSEINPGKLGNKSEKHSEINPTYKEVSINKEVKDKDLYVNKKNKPSNIPIPKDIDPELWQSWMEVRKRKKAVNNEIAITALLRRLDECEQHGYEKNFAIKVAIEESWKSVKFDWIDNLTKTNKKTSEFAGML